MRTETPKTIYLKDYTPYPYEIESVELDFNIQDGYTIVTQRAHYNRTLASASEVFLYGEELELLSVKINNQEVDGYNKTDASLTVPCSESSFDLEIQTKIYPENNTRLEGLYNSGGTYCTQCEAEGFRRITYYPDRPDVLTTFTVRIEADKKYPVLLSNGNRIEGGEVDSDRHFTIWEDPFPKPCYLFALVAGDLNHIHDTYITGSGREVDLYIYVREGDESQCDHAMDSLKRSMKWDEDVYGLEYDLDIFNIVAVSDFNMGAMENKSLNIFNTALVLAHQETATDTDFMRVESVIAHEYFHNWSGNRVTCRDWFQLSLKEGLTVFRDQEFSADTHSKDVQRIDDVTHLRRFQFAEDASPLAHPIRPDNYIEINNFYTMTVYEKGAEVIRMMRTLLGAENYRKGTDLYFERHDGQAVTCEDFVKAMEDATGEDLSQFRLWYEQAGTPELHFKGEYDADRKEYKVTLSQVIPDTPNQTNKKPMVIPVAIGLIGQDGEDLIGTQVLKLTEGEQEFTFSAIEQEPVPSVLRNFSAPVRLKTNLSQQDYAFLSQNEAYDGFNRWEAGQHIARTVIGEMLDAHEAGEKMSVPEAFTDGYAAILEDALSDGADKALLARSMSVPDVSALIQERQSADPEAIFKARELVIAAIKRNHKSALEKIYKSNAMTGEFSVTSDAMAQRVLRNVALMILTGTHGTGCAKRAKEHYFNADNMTDRVAALSSLASNKNPERDEVFSDFYDRFKDYQLVIDKWFALQSCSTLPDAIDRIKALKEHQDFNIKNPNRVRSLYAAFAMNNPSRFHAADGSGYAFLRDAIIELNDINPQIAARLLTPMREWRRYTTDRQDMIKAALSDILAIENIAPDVFEIASKSLKG
ncbi:MAG: aminopeptidase N [Alcanivorax sp.]